MAEEQLLANQEQAIELKFKTAPSVT